MDFDKIVEKRHSVRTFTGKVVSWKDVLVAIDAAIKGPGAGGDLPFKFIIVENAKKIDKIAEQCDQLWINQASIIVVITSDDKHLEKMYGDRGRIFSRQQAGAAINTFLLKLVDLGLSGCWVGSYNDNKIRHLLAIPSEKQIEAIIPIGYEKPSPKTNRGKSRKRKLENYLFWDAWDQESRNPIFKENTSHKFDQHGHPL